MTDTLKAPAAFPLIEIEGAAAQRGRQYGRAAGERIALSLATYRAAYEKVGLDWTRTHELARRFVPQIATYDADSLAEIEGIAAGAEVALEDIVALNARSELLYAHEKLGASEPPDGCTGLVVLPEASASGRLIHAQNWDWRVESAALGIVLRIRPDVGPAMLTFVEAGMLARAGFNEHGIATTGNFLRSATDGAKAGVPLPLIRRAILKSEILAQALSVVFRSARTVSNNMIISHAGGEAVSLETCPEEVFWQLPQNGVLVHANHFKTPGALAKVRDRSLETSPDSLYRDRRVEAALAEKAPRIGREDVIAALSDRYGSPRAVCRSPSVGPGGATSCTVATIVMQPQDRRMWIAPTPFTEHRYTEYTL
jgi:isopenicillin-N N-acyltransferase like protein